MKFPLLYCKGGHFGLFFLKCFVSLAGGTAASNCSPLRECLTTLGDLASQQRKPLVTANQPAPQQCASCKGAFEEGRHGLPEKGFRPWISLNFSDRQVLHCQGPRFMEHQACGIPLHAFPLPDAFCDPLVKPPYGMPCQ